MDWAAEDSDLKVAFPTCTRYSPARSMIVARCTSPFLGQTNLVPLPSSSGVGVLPVALSRAFLSSCAAS